MAKEIVATFNNSSELIIEMAKNDSEVHKWILGSPETGERVYGFMRLEDADGNELKFPVTLINDTREG